MRSMRFGPTINDDLLITWLRGNMNEEVLNLVSAETAYDVWHLLEEQLLPAKKERKHS